MPALTRFPRHDMPMHDGQWLRARWFATVWLAFLTGCANDPSTQRHDAAAVHGRATATTARTPSQMLRGVGAAAPTDSPCRAHDPTPGELSKQRSVIDALRAPALYNEVFYGHRSDSLAAFTVDGMLFRQYRQFDDSDSGLSGIVLLDDASGHALILFKGMDRPFAERGGLGGVLTDLGSVLSAKFGSGNDQLPPADSAYTEALCEEVIESIEMVGYSIGSQIANYLAVKYGAYGVVFGDMGLDATLLRRHARGDLEAARTQARQHIVSLSLGGDVVVKVFGVGEVLGTVVKLPGGLAGVLHQPEIYANAANAKIRDRDRADKRGESDGRPPHAGEEASSPDPGVTRSRAADRGGMAEDAQNRAAQH